MKYYEALVRPESRPEVVLYRASNRTDLERYLLVMKGKRAYGLPIVWREVISTASKPVGILRPVPFASAA